MPSFCIILRKISCVLVFLLVSDFFITVSYKRWSEEFYLRKVAWIVPLYIFCVIGHEFFPHLFGYEIKAPHHTFNAPGISYYFSRSNIKTIKYYAQLNKNYSVQHKLLLILKVNNRVISIWLSLYKIKNCIF